MSRDRAPSLGPIFLTVVLDLLGFGLVFPFLAEEARDSFHAPAILATALSSVYSLMQFLFVPVWGRLSDRIGRRPVLVWSVLATAIGMAGLACSLAFHLGIWALFAARMWSGIATANLGTASAYIADVTKPEDRAKGMGLIGAAFGIGFVFGPFVGGVLAPILVNGHSGVWPCALAAVLSLVNFTWVFFGVPESFPAEKRSKAPRSMSPLNIEGIRYAATRPGMLAAVLVNFVVIVSFSELEQTFRWFNKDLFAMDQRSTGYLFGVIGITGAIVQGGIVRRLPKGTEDARVIGVGTALQWFAFALLAISPSVGRWLLYVAGIVLALGNGLTQPSTSAYISKRADAANQGSALSTSQSFASLARMVGPLLGGFFYGSIGPRVPYIVASAGMLFAFVLSLRLPRGAINDLDVDPEVATAAPRP